MTSCISYSQDCLKFLKEVLGDGANDAADSSVQQQHAAIMNVYQETCSTFFKVLQNSSIVNNANCYKCQINYFPLYKILQTITMSLNVNMQVLQAHSGQLVSHQLLEEIKRLHVSSNPKIQSAVTDAATSDGSSEAIEAEANTYFHQMFSGQLSIDAIVQMLASELCPMFSGQFTSKWFNCSIIFPA